MTMPENFSLEDGYARFSPAGEFTLESITLAVDKAIAYCRQRAIRGLLVDVREVTGFPSPTVGERFVFISRWAATSEGQVRLSLVARPEMVLEDKFGVMVASNRGMISNVFTDPDEAQQWLIASSRLPGVTLHHHV